MNSTFSPSSGNSELNPPITYPTLPYDELFPFHFVMDKKYTILHVGPSLHKLSPFKGQLLTDWYDLKKPECSLDFFLSEPSFIDQLTILSSTSDSKLTLTGHFKPLPEDQGWVFLGSPWLHSIEDLNQLGLAYNDYALNDNSLGQLHLMRSQEIASKDIRALAKKLSSQQEELQLLSTIVQNASHAVLVLDRESIIQYANDAAEYITGRLSTEIVGKSVFTILAQGNNMQEWVQLFRPVLEGVSCRGEMKNDRPDGTTIWVRILGQPIIDFGGKIDKYFLIIEDVTEKHRSDELLRKSEEQLKLSVEGSGEGIWSLNITTGELIVSDQFLRLIDAPIGRPIEEKDVLRKIHADDRPKVTQRLEDLIAGNTDTIFCEFRIVKTDGTVAHFQKKGRRTSLFSDGTQRVAGTLSDVTIQKNLEYQLLLSANRFSNLLSNMQTGVLMEDDKRRIVLVNQTCCDMFGFEAKAEHLIGIDCSNLAEESKHLFVDEDAFVDRIDQLLFDQKPVIGEEIQTKSGYIIERDYIPLFIDDTYRGHFWQYRDITARKSAELLLRRNEEKYRNIIENMHLGLLEVDLEERIQYANESFCEMSGFSVSALLGKKTTEIFPVESEDLVKEKQELRAEGILDTYEINIRFSEENSRWWLISGAPMYDQNGKHTGSIGIHLDITEQKRLQEQLLVAKMRAEESNIAKDKFLANVSHELRTPVNGIIGMSRNLARTALLPEQKKYLHMLKSATDQLLVMLNDVLDLAKIDAGKIHLDYRSFNLPSAIYKSIDVVQSRAEEKGIPLRIQMDDSLSMVYIGEEKRLRQVLINILSNAVKFTEKGFVQITCTKMSGTDKKDLVMIEVVDTGIGMDDNFKERLFQKFAQEDENSSRHYGGTGLGLSICKELIELMGGKIDVQSVKDKGTTVQLLLPFEIGKPEDLTPEAVEFVDSSLLSNSKILLVEDNELNQIVVTIALEHFGATISSVFSGKDALDKLQAEVFDLVLMDIQMPGMDGYETARLIREKLGPELPIIALSANVLRGEAEKSFAAGMNDFIAKPFEEEQLIQKVVQQLSKRIDKKAPGAVLSAAKINITYDLSYLEKSSHNNAIFFKKMLDVFIQQGKNTARELREAVDRNEVRLIADLSHKVKPGLQHLKTGIIADQALWLERCIKAGASIEDVRSEAENFIENLLLLVELMDNERNDMPS